MMPKDELSVLKMDFVKLRMCLNNSYIEKHSLLQFFTDIRNLKKRLVQEIHDIFDINYNNIDIIDQMSNYDFLIELYNFFIQIGPNEDNKTVTNTLPVPIVFARAFDCKMIKIWYTEFFEQWINIHPCRFISICSLAFDKKEEFQFCNGTILSLENKITFMNVMRSIYSFLIDYVDQICPSNMEIIRLYNENKSGQKHLFRK